MSGIRNRMAKERGRKPAYRLSVLRADTGKKGVVGAAWREDDGSISITINPCVTLRGDDDVHIKLFPTDEGWRPASRVGDDDKAPSTPEASSSEDGEVPPFT